MAFELPPITKEEEEALNAGREYEECLVKRYPSWILFLNRNQSYLGRAYIWLRRHQDLHPLSALTTAESYELTRILIEYSRALRLALGQPNHIDCGWTVDGLKKHRGHGHLRLTPRYAIAQAFLGEEFHDLRFGTPAGDSVRTLQEHQFLQLRDTLRAYLPRE